MADYHSIPVNHKESCPCCNHNLGSFQTEDGETAGANLNSPERSLYDASLLWGSCEHCNARLYTLFIYIASKPFPGEFLLVNGMHEYDYASDEQWVTNLSPIISMKHFENVRNVKYFKENAERKHELEWLDFYSTKLFTFDPSRYNRIFDQADDIVHRLVKQILSDKPWPWMRKSNQLSIDFPTLLEPF